MMRRTTLVCLLAVALLAPGIALAEHTRYWRESDYSEFEKGTPKGVALRSDGKLLPAPRFESFSDPNLAYVWALRLDSHGRLFAAGGSDAKVLRFDDAGKPASVFESTELAAQAIAFDAKDNLYVGTSPDGKVYKVTPDGQKSVFFEPKTKYIWALAMDPQGDLFVATGDTGEVFVVAPDGKGKMFYQSDERHARSLAFDSKGNLLIGTEPDGLILRVEVSQKKSEPLPEAGPAFVVYETDRAEVTSLIQDARGNLYAASVGEKVHNQGAPRIIPAPRPQNNEAAPAAQGTVTIIQSQPSAQPSPYPVQTSGGAEVVKIAPDGSPETLWTSRDNLVFAMGLTPAGKLLLGTGDDGSVIQLEGNQTFSSIAKTASVQVTDLIVGAGGKIFVATANPGKIFTIGPGYESGGSFESQTFDAKIFSHWGRLTWQGDGLDNKVALYARSGNTSNPENNWSAWSGPYKANGDTVDCPAARFVQWKAVFLDSTSSGTEPDISWVSLAYQPKNVAPVIDDIAIQNPGVRISSFSAQPGGPGSSVSAQLRMPQTDGSTHSSASDDSSSAVFHVDVPPQGFEDKGYQSVLWSAHDENDDSLVYSIYYRGDGEKNWRLLKDKITQKYYSWDTSTLPDGAYYLKIVASDSPSNPPDQSLSAERESDRFEIANTPPKIELLRADASASPTKISFVGVSSFGAIAHAQYDLDAGDWQVVFPVGLLSDSPKENYQIELSALPPGEHTVAITITDRFSNSTTSKVTFTIPARPAT